MALVHILKSKAELTTTRIKRLLEVLSAYSFNLYYIKGKDMILSDFLSRQRTDDSNPHEIIPISYAMQAILTGRYYNIGQRQESRYLIQTQPQAKISGIKLLAVHGADKGVDPSVKPEKKTNFKTHKISDRTKSQVQSKPILGQGKAGLRSKMKIPGVDQVKEETLPKQKEVLQPPLMLCTVVLYGS